MVELSTAQKLRCLEAVIELMLREANELQERHDLAKVEARGDPVHEALTAWYQQKLAECANSIEEAHKQWTGTKSEK